MVIILVQLVVTMLGEKIVIFIGGCVDAKKCSQTEFL
jgi:hypothetical protein